MAVATRTRREAALSEPTVRFWDLKDIDEDSLARWHRLVAEAIDPNLYLDPRYCIPTLSFGDHEGAMLASVVAGDEWLAAAMFMPMRVPLLRGTRTVLTTGNVLTEQLGRTHALVSPKDPGRSLATLIRGVARKVPSGIVQFDDYFADGPFAAALEEAVVLLNAPVLRDARGLQPYASQASPIPTETRDIYGPTYASKSRRENMRRHARVLQERTGTTLTYVNHGADMDAFRAFVDLQSRGWKGDTSRGGTALALREDDRGAFTQAMMSCGEDGSMFVGGLYAGDEPVHMTIFFTDHRRIVCAVLDAYDEEYRDVRAGSLGRLAALAAMRTTYPTLDFDPAIRIAPADVAGIYPERRPMAGMSIAAGSPTGRAIVRLAALARRMRDD
jgi:hypothetical protein